MNATTKNIASTHHHNWLRFHLIGPLKLPDYLFIGLFTVLIVLSALSVTYIQTHHRQLIIQYTQLKAQAKQLQNDSNELLKQENTMTNRKVVMTKATIMNMVLAKKKKLVILN